MIKKILMGLFVVSLAGFVALKSSGTSFGSVTKPMVLIQSGKFWMGNFNDHMSMGPDNNKMSDAQPWHQVSLSSYWIDRYPVTNQDFEVFVKATGYTTVAERKPDIRDYPGARPELLVAGSVVFSPPRKPVPLDNNYRWWTYVQGANWRHPEGPGSNLKNRLNHPVVHIAWGDANAYCKWAGKRLPTEAEFEFAARGGLDRKRYAWGDEFKPKGHWMANTFQGHFPDRNASEDGYVATSPVGAFPANGYGLYDMAGNVWEWCSDWYRPDYYQTLSKAGEDAPRNPQGPSDSFDPGEPGTVKRVMRGGSFLCTDQYCSRYEAGGRGKGEPDTGTNHLGFRCVNPS